MRAAAPVLAALIVFSISGCGDTDRSPSGSLAPTAPARTLGSSGPDLVLTQFEITAVTDNSVSYSWTIMNVGDQPAVLEGPTPVTADNVAVQALLSQDTVFGNAGDSPAGGTVVGVSPIADLMPGQTLSGSFTSNTPGATPCDFNYLTLMVDVGEAVGETNEANNFAAAAIDCCPDMVIDIKPGSDVNSINPKSKGVIPVAILGSADLDVEEIDWSTITFGPGGAREAHKSGGHLEDVNNDGYMDLMLHFRTQDSGILAGDTEACLSAELDNGCRLSDCDAVRTVPAPELAGP